MDTNSVLFCKHAVWCVHIKHTQRKGGNQQDRTKACCCKDLLGLCSDVLPNIIGRAKNNLMLFLYRFILCTHTYSFLLLRSIKNNVGYVSKTLHPRTLQTCPLFLLSNLTWPFQR